MEIKTTFSIWRDVTIEEKKPDVWGREGRGRPFAFYNSNHKYHNKKWVSVQSLVERIEDVIVDEEVFYDIDYPAFKTFIESIIEELEEENNE